MKVWRETRKGFKPSPANIAGREAYEISYAATGDHSAAHRAYSHAFRKAYQATPEGHARRLAYDASRRPDRRSPEARAANRVRTAAYYADPEHRAAKNERSKGYYRQRMSSEAGVKKAREQANQGHAKLRQQILSAYGGSCSCCGDATPEFLTLDHIYGDGGQHRAAGIKVYVLVRRQGFPKDRYRLLCMNCNFAIRYGAECPHQRGVRQLLSTLQVAETV